MAKGEIEATRVQPGLYIGSAPPIGRAVKDARFDMLVLCAKEYQFPFFERVEVVYAPNDDTCKRFPTEQEFRIAYNASERVAQAYADGRRVLITCMQGRNRSGLVMALALRRIFGMSGTEARKLVQRKRERALANPFFARSLDTLPELPFWRRVHPRVAHIASQPPAGVGA